MRINARALVIGLVVAVVAIAAGLGNLGGLTRTGLASASGIPLLCAGRGAPKPGGGCTCETGFAGATCQYSSAATCNGHGAPQANGSCMCSGGWLGAACTVDPKKCGLNGNPRPDGSCACNPGWAVDTNAGPNGACVAYLGSPECNYAGSPSGLPPASGMPCNCFAGKTGRTCACAADGTASWGAGGACNCKPGFGGASCGLTDATACNGHGAVQASGACSCTAGFGGANCGLTDAAACNGHGAVQASGACVCHAGWVGAGCATPASPNCSDAGAWDPAQQTCTCAHGFTGPRCQYSG